MGVFSLHSILISAKEIEEYIISLRRKLHQYPELALQEFKTAEFIERELDAYGIEHTRVGETGVLGTIKGKTGGHGRVLVLRADIDALPIEETMDFPYKSKHKGIMHACGHDAHVACLLGAAKLLSKNIDRISGEIRLVFQQAEEIGKGAVQFINSGYLNGVDRVFGLHIAPDLKSGTVGIRAGCNNAAVDYFKATINGISTHVSTPQKGADALYIAAQAVVAVQALATRCTSPTEPVLIGIGKLCAGTAYNAVAKTAVLEGTTRTVTVESREFLRQKVTAVFEYIAKLYGGTAELEWENYTSPLINDAQVCQEVVSIAEEMLGKENVIKDRELSLGGDDFAEFILKSKGAYAYLGTRSVEVPNSELNLHNGCTTLDERALHIGTALHTAYALWYLSDKT